MHYLVLILFFAISLFSKDTIVWNSVEFPPSLITKGKMKDQGYSDKARLLMSRELTEYEHKLQYVNSARAISNLKEKQNHCFSGLNKNPAREEFIHFSDALILSLPNELVIKKDKYDSFLPFMTRDGVVDFEKLISNQQLNFVYTKDRAYNPFIDKIITLNTHNSNVFYRPASDLTSGFLEMLRVDRADYIIEYPTMVEYHSKNEFLTIPIKNANTNFEVFIGCSKTDTGKRIIQKINQVIMGNKPLLNSFYASHLGKETKERYLKSVQK